MAKELTEHFRAEHARLSALIEALTKGVFLVDTDDAITEFNNQLANLLEVQAQDYLGQPYRKLFARLVERAAEPEVVQQSLSQAVVAVAERPVIELATAGQPIRNLEATFFPVWEEDGSPVGWGGLIHDVTDERERAAWKLELLSILSHDIRAPLATLKGHATALLGNYRQWDQQMVAEFLEAINRSTDSLIKQVERNLALTRVESGRLGLRPEACRPQRLIEQALERAAALLNEAEVKVELPPDLPQVRADPARVEELLINLLENAVRYTPAGQPIEIGATTQNRSVLISVTDLGAGVPAERQREIFHRDMQGGSRAGSSGLGLYISRKIAEAHGGKLWVESPIPGYEHGTRFTFSLPEMPKIEPRRESPGPQAASLPAAGDQLRVLVVEDEVDFQALLRTTLTEAGYQVEVAQDGPSAVDVVQMSSPDLVVLDWVLPGMSGLQAARNIRRWSKAPILMVTSKTAQEDLVAAFEAGVDDYLTKPFQTAELLARLHALARRRQVAAEDDQHSLNVNGLTIDYGARRVWLAGRTVELTPTEYELLAHLAQHRGQVLTYQQLLEHLYGSRLERSRHDLFVHVSRLRKKIEADPDDPEFIQTRWGVGYVFSPR